jgi:hypothetical protein
MADLVRIESELRSLHKLYQTVMAFHSYLGPVYKGGGVGFEDFEDGLIYLIGRTSVVKNPGSAPFCGTKNW